MSGTVADKLKDAKEASAVLNAALWEIACEHDAWRDKWKELCDATGCGGHATALQWIENIKSDIERLTRELNTSTSHSEDYRKCWLALRNATGTQCQIEALEWIESAREVAESLKADLRAVEEDRAAVAKERDELSEKLERIGGEVCNLTTERLDLEEKLLKASRQIEEFDVSGKRQDETITRLMTQKGMLEDELSSYKDALRIAQKDRDDWKAASEALGEGVNERDAKVLELTRERDEARELCRRFRDATRSQEYGDCCREYDAKYGDPAPPVQDDAGELVPWTAATRPSEMIWLRNSGDDLRRWLVTFWGPDGPGDSGGGDMSWTHVFEHYEWSSDGINWQPCGTRKAVQQ